MYRIQRLLRLSEKMIDWHVTGPLVVTGVFSFAMLGVSTWNAVLLVRDSEKEIKVRFFHFTFFERFSNDSSRE